jgi:hypothetical protein
MEAFPSNILFSEKYYQALEAQLHWSAYSSNLSPIEKL